MEDELNLSVSDAVLAFAIGALVGVGAALLLRADDVEDDVSRAIEQLRGRGMHAHRASRRLQRELSAAVALARRTASTG
jgi:hypothetical protein